MTAQPWKGVGQQKKAERFFNFFYSSSSGDTVERKDEPEINGSMGSEAETFSVLGLDESEKQTPGFPRIIPIISSILERLIDSNEKSKRPSKRKETVTIFHGSRAPTLSVRQYLERIFKYTNCSPSCFVTAYIYMDRFEQKTHVPLNSLNVHRLLITATMVAAKFLDSGCYNNAHYARVGGVSKADMNRMEIEFLFSLDFKLLVTNQVFISYCLQLQKESSICGQQIGQSGIASQPYPGRKAKPDNRPSIKASSCKPM